MLFKPETINTKTLWILIAVFGAVFLILCVVLGLLMVNKYRAVIAMTSVS